MATYTDPAQYWETRLSHHFDLMGVGHALLGPNYNARLYQARQQTLDAALQSVGRSLLNTKVLEVGCGSGFYTELSMQAGVRSYVGVDLTDVSVNSLRVRFPQYEFFRADITEAVSNEISHEFDVIIVADVLFHIVDDDAFERAIANLSSRLAMGGLLILSDVFPARTAQTAPHCRNRSLEHYRASLQVHAIEIIKVEPIFVLLHPPPLLEGAPRFWRWYARLWRHVLYRVARLPTLDRVFSQALGGLDRRFLLASHGLQAPNSKWLLAAKNAIA